jgi:SpoU rRNA methylase family enzyme
VQMRWKKMRIEENVTLLFFNNLEQAIDCLG